MSIAIIGGGASAMFLASKLKNKDVTIFEKNDKLGKKLLLTGNGKCNFTSGNFDNLNEIYNNDFAIDIYNMYDNNSFISFFRSIGIVPKKEIHKGNIYYYPNTNKSLSVYYNLLDKIIENGCKIIYNAEVIDIKLNGEKFIIILKNGKEYIFDKIVLATGGRSYINTGSSGDGYILAKKFSHNIIGQVPALCSLKVSNKDLANIKNIRVDGLISAYKNDHGDKICLYQEYGEIQFTKNCISGIPIFNISRYVNKYLDDNINIYLNIDFSSNEFVENLCARHKNIKYKLAKDFLCGYLPDEIGRVIIERANINGDKYVKDLTENEIDNINYNISNFKIDICGHADFDTAQITMGGVDVNEIDKNTLMSQLIKNLHFIGEIMDIDGKCGGYNLQLAYSTAMIVSSNI